MRKVFIYSACIFLFTGCGTMDQATKSIFSTQAGAAIGNIAGSIIGENIGGYRGSFFGSIIGTGAGAVIGAGVAARTSPDTEQYAPSTPFPSPYLVIRDIRLLDENRNKLVDADENCQLVFEIFNDGEETALDVKPVLKGLKGTKQLIYSSPLVIDQIKPKEAVQYTVNLSASSKVRTGDANFEIYLDERNGFGTSKEEFTIRTQKKLY